MMEDSGVKKNIGQWLIAALLSIVAIVQLYPLVWLVFFSLKDNYEIFGGNIMGLPGKFLWQNYAVALQEAKVGLYFLNSVKVTALTIFFGTLLALTTSYAIARMKWRFSRQVLSFFLLGMMIPGQAIVLPVFLIAQKSRLVNTHFYLIIIYIVFSLPLSIYILTSFMKTLPKELEESAFMDGANIYQTFFLVIVPVIKSAVVTVIILNFLYTWNEFMFSYILVDKEALRTMPVGLAALNGVYNTDWGPIGAGMVVATLPTILIYSVFSSQIQKSLIAGSVKG